MKTKDAIKRLMAFMLVALVSLSTTAFSISQPIAPVDPLSATSGDLLTITKPPAPTSGECTEYWAESNSRCSGDLRIYNQCVRKVVGGEWEQRTEDCTAYPDGYCMDGKCYTSGNEATPIGARMDYYIKIIALCMFVIGGIGLILKKLKW